MRRGIHQIRRILQERRANFSVTAVRI